MTEEDKLTSVFPKVVPQGTPVVLLDTVIDLLQQDGDRKFCQGPAAKNGWTSLQPGKEFTPEGGLSCLGTCVTFLFPANASTAD